VSIDRLFKSNSSGSDAMVGKRAFVEISHC